MNEEEFSTQIKFEEPSQQSSSETDSGFNCSERKSLDTNSLSDEIETLSNETSFNNSRFDSSDVDMLEIKCEIDYSTNLIDSDSITHVFSSETISVEATSSELTSSNINSCDNGNENPNVTSLTNMCSDFDSLESELEKGYSTNQIDPHEITHVFSCPSQLSSSETISTEATSSDLTSSNINSCDGENENLNMTSLTNKCSDFDSSESKCETDYSTNQIDSHEITHVYVCPMCQKKFVSQCDTREHLSKVTRDNRDCL